MPKQPEPYQNLLYEHLFKAIHLDCGAEAIAELARKGVDFNYFDPYSGRTALYSATIANRVQVIKALLLYGANPNQKFTYRSPLTIKIEPECIALHYASSGEAAAALIAAGADVNSANATGTTPLMRAAFNGHIDVVKTLLAAGASPLTREKKCRGHKPRTALELAESKAEFWRSATGDKNRDAAERRLLCYEEIRAILTKAAGNETL